MKSKDYIMTDVHYQNKIQELAQAQLVDLNKTYNHLKEKVHKEIQCMFDTTAEISLSYIQEIQQDNLLEHDEDLDNKVTIAYEMLTDLDKQQQSLQPQDYENIKTNIFLDFKTKLYWSVSKNHYILMGDLEPVIYDKDTTDHVLKMFYPTETYDTQNPEHVLNTKKDHDQIQRSIQKQKMNDLKTYIKLEKQFISRRINYTPFEPEGYSINESKELVEVINDIFPVNLQSIEEYIKLNPDYDLYIEDYKEHFSDFDKLLSFIVATRFSSNRKMGALHLKRSSNWGKGILFENIFPSLRLSVDISMEEIKEFGSGNTGSKTLQDFMGTWIMFFDEVNYIDSSFKKMNDTILVTPKYHHGVRVDIYSKVLCSADDVPSLMSGSATDDQIGKRFTYMYALEESQNRPITSRKLFKGRNNEYINALRVYVYNFLKTKADEYIQMGEAVSLQQAFTDLGNIQAEINNRIDIIDMTDKIKGRTNEIIQYIKDTLNSEIGENKGIQDFHLRNEINQNCKIIARGKNKDSIFVTKTNILLDVYASVFSDTSTEFKSINHYKNQPIIFDYEKSTSMFEGVLINGYRIDQVMKLPDQHQEEHGLELKISELSRITM